MHAMQLDSMGYSFRVCFSPVKFETRAIITTEWRVIYVTRWNMWA